MRRAAAVLLVAAVVALPALRNGFVYDDVPAIVENPLVHSLTTSPRIWISSYWSSGLLYRPLTIQGFALEWWLGGGAPWAFHLAGLLLYAGVALLVYRIARRLLPEPGALVAGLVFAAHPVHVEVVANSVGQSELLAAIFGLLAIDRYLAWRSQGGTGPGRRGVLAGLCLLSIAAKETGYVFPALLFAVELLGPLPGGEPEAWRSRIRRVGPLFIMLAAGLAAALLVRGILFLNWRGEVAQLPLRDYQTGERAVAMLAVVPQWVRLLVWPVHLQAHYGPPELPVAPQLSGDHVAGIGLLVMAAGLLLFCRRRAPVVALGVAWIGIGLAPVSNIVTATGVLLAERTLFLPSVGLAFAVGWAVNAVATRIRGRRAGYLVAAGGVTAVLALGAIRSVERSDAWRTQDEFFARLEGDAPGSYRARLAAGTYYLGIRRFPEAERALQAAWTLYQDDPAVSETYGQLYRVQHRCDRALPIFTAGLARHPDATVLRARLIECALAVGDSARARMVAAEAVERGQVEFRGTLERLTTGRSARP